MVASLCTETVEAGGSRGEASSGDQQSGGLEAEDQERMESQGASYRCEGELDHPT